MSLEKPSSAEDEYFLREEAARKKREALEKSRTMEKTDHDQLKALHYMKCPKCGFDLSETKIHKTLVDKCYHCGGIWLDKGEWEQLAASAESGLFYRLSKVFSK